MTPAAVGDPSLNAQFAEFDRANPQVFVEFKRLAERMYNELVEVGDVPVFGAKFVWERLRWSVRISPAIYGKGFKLDNDLVSRYARKLAEQDGRFANAFRFRVLKRRNDF